ncbi:phage terminase large subunit [Ralstonia pseudosolanacearum]|uniref:phage terminase large subunit n=1 Tax=Ralstonia pseudosolanacearum TaxID=1310165 RepID=UPI00186645C5|nr:phage terminase large subunit [Ralstonia pseudosolanacearum]QOK91564.1 phage terminase large subunit [Ralstonia pseudosolanacearum]
MKNKEFKDQIAALAENLRRKIDAEVMGFEPGEAAAIERRERAHDDLEFFARTYFPHYVKHAPSKLHSYLFKRLEQIAGTGAREAIAAPRGNAKSTIVTQIATVWRVVTGRAWYPCLIMDAFEQAAEMLEAIKAELEFNPRLANDFPAHCGAGKVWRAGVAITPSGVKLEAFGSGKKIRGRRHGPYRPDWVVLDDVENDENVESPQQRDKLERWIDRSVLSLGSTDDVMDVVFVGTILHYDSVLARKLRHPLWSHRIFKSILEWPANMALWDQWEETLLNAPTKDEGEALALAFYQDRQAEMDAGAVVLWPAGQPLYKLMIKRARDGHDAFDSEQQNDPSMGADAPFANSIQFWVNRLSQWVFYGACDPSLGKAGGSRDPSAIGVGGLNRETGVLDVVEAQIKKRLPDRIIEDIISMHEQYRCIVWLIEAIQFQEFLRTELVKRSAARGCPVPARPIQPGTDKVLRIESLQPHMANGLIRLHMSQHTLIQQFKHFPKADHDDGPDMVHMLWTAAQSGLSRMTVTSTGRRAVSRRSMADYTSM